MVNKIDELKIVIGVMSHVVLFTAPYMRKDAERFERVLSHYGIQILLPDVKERLSEDELLVYAGKFDCTICGDDKYTEKVLLACVKPGGKKLKVICKWGTGVGK